MLNLFFQESKYKIFLQDGTTISFRNSIQHNDIKAPSAVHRYLPHAMFTPWRSTKNVKKNQAYKAQYESKITYYQHLQGYFRPDFLQNDTYLIAKLLSKTNRKKLFYFKRSLFVCFHNYLFLISLSVSICNICIIFTMRFLLVFCSKSAT